MEGKPDSSELSRLLWSMVLAAVVVSGGLFLISGSSSASVGSGVGSAQAVYVQLQLPDAGAAVYRMQEGSRMGDLFRAARRKAPVGIDAGASILSGQSVSLEEDGGVSITWMAGERMVTLGSPIPLNDCGMQDLIAIPGIGEATARKLMKGRLDRGRFDSFSEMASLQGIGKQTVAALQQYGRL